MKKGYQANNVRPEVVSLFARPVGKRAGIKYEW